MAARRSIDVLSTLLPPGRVVTDPDIIEGYRFDRAADPRAGTPLAVFRPRTTAEVRSAVRWAARREAQEACEAHGATESYTTSDQAEGEAFVAARRAVIPALELTGDLLLEDVGVPLPELPDLVRGVEAVSAEFGVTVALVAHAGDGNTHPLVVHDAQDPDSTRRAMKAFDAVMDLALSLDGTITGEHGVGRLKRPWLPAYLGPDGYALNQRIKTALDPQGILNPGAML